METLFQSFLLVAVGEMGDKTQLLALVLSARYRKPRTILAGILVATLANHALAAGLGEFLAGYFAPATLRWALGITFILFAAWVLIPDKESEVKEIGHFGAFFATVVAFFVAEMGDKTQLATVALGAQFQDPWLVTAGTTLGMLATNGLAVFFGQRLLDRIPMKWVRAFAALLFVGFGIWVLVG
jgi:putative Ca2+/H+ antiporter (TMEM165/GDT1 family)